MPISLILAITLSLQPTHSEPHLLDTTLRPPVSDAGTAESRPPPPASDIGIGWRVAGTIAGTLLGMGTGGFFGSAASSSCFGGACSAVAPAVFLSLTGAGSVGGYMLGLTGDEGFIPSRVLIVIALVGEVATAVVGTVFVVAFLSRGPPG